MAKGKDTVKLFLIYAVNTIKGLISLCNNSFCVFFKCSFIKNILDLSVTMLLFHVLDPHKLISYSSILEATLLPIFHLFNNRI